MPKTFQHPPYTYLKDGIYYFSKSVPVDLRHHYLKPRIIQSLRTKSYGQAKLASKMMASKLDDYWLKLRLKNIEIPAAHLLVSNDDISQSDLPTIDDAMELYLEIKGRDKNKTFVRSTKRNIGYLKSCLGARALDQYTTADAAKLRQWLLDKQLSSGSLKRIFGNIKAIVNFTIQEQGLDIRNSFAGIYLPSNEGTIKRHPISDSNIRKLQKECIRLNDDIRWLVALISDTGMRLSEATGLMMDDLCITDKVPHVKVRPHPHRRLKTVSSERSIPLIGLSLWAAKEIKKSQNDLYCFPRYTSERGCNANSASAAINKWLKTVSGSSSVIHSLRHSFRDRLRAVETPTDMIDQLGGWSLKSIGQGYGNGYKIELLHTWIQKIVLTTPE